MNEPDIDPLRGELAKKTAECRVLNQQLDELRAEIATHRVFVRLCSAIFPALDGARAAHAALAERAKQLIAPNEPPCTH